MPVLSAFSAAIEKQVRCSQCLSGVGVGNALNGFVEGKPGAAHVLATELDQALPGLPEEEHHGLADQALGWVAEKVLDFVTKAGNQFDLVDACFLKELAPGRREIIFLLFDVSLWIIPESSIIEKKKHAAAVDASILAKHDDSG